MRCVPLWVGLVVALGSCKGGTSSAPPPEPTGGLPLLGADCDPIAPAHCGLPFPSNVWLVDGKVTFGPTTLPALNGKPNTDPTLWLDKDGFSPGQAALVVLPGAQPDGLPNSDTIAASILPDAPSIL